MAFSVTHSYSKSADVVMKMFTDRDYIVKKYEATGASNIDIQELENDGKKFRVKSKRDVPLNVPSFAKKFLKESSTIIEIDEWELEGDVKKGNYTVEIQGVPIRMKGTMRVSSAGSGSENIIESEITVKVPLVGGKIAKFLEGDTRKNLDEDYAFTSKFLETYEG